MTEIMICCFSHKYEQRRTLKKQCCHPGNLTINSLRGKQICTRRSKYKNDIWKMNALMIRMSYELS